MRILLDHNLPRQLARALGGHEVGVAASLGWAELSNGELLQQAEHAGFDCLITGDRNMMHQQNLRRRTIALVVLNSTRRSVVLPQAAAIAAALERLSAGSCVQVTLTLPPRRRQR